MTTAAKRKATTTAILDIFLVFAVSGIAIFLERLVLAKGWLAIEASASGVSGVIAGVAAAIFLTYKRGGNLRAMGFRRPDRWALVPLWVIGILLVFFAAQIVIPQAISLFIDVPAPDMSKYDSLRGNLGAAIVMALILPLTASIPEEIIYRGFLMGRLEEIFGTARAGVILTVLVQGIIFSLAHYQWGIGGILLTFFMGVIWGSAYVLSGRNLWIVIIAHSTGHVLWVAQLYLG